MEVRTALFFFLFGEVASCRWKCADPYQVVGLALFSHPDSNMSILFPQVRSRQPHMHVTVSIPSVNVRTNSVVWAPKVSVRVGIVRHDVAC